MSVETTYQWLEPIGHAIGNLLATGLPIENEVQILNHWR
jgi:hypothetical protein